MDILEARNARFDEEDQLMKLRNQKAQERSARLEKIKPGTKVIPACQQMCPEFEMIDRQVTNDVSIFEATMDSSTGGGRLLIDPSRAVKKFRRSAAGNYELGEDLRPPIVLQRTMKYLMEQVLNRTDQPYSTVYGFVRDRTRAIRTDLTLQNCRDAASIQIHEWIARFLIASGHLLCEEERTVFEPQQNTEQLNGCLSALREMYKTWRDQGFPESSNEPEFQAYGILLSIDKKEAVNAISSLHPTILNTERARRALKAYSAYQQCNIVKFLELISDPQTTYLEACLLHQFLHSLRHRTLDAMTKLPAASANSFARLSLSELIRWFGFVDLNEIIYYSDRYGLGLITDSMGNIEGLDLTFIIGKRMAEDLKAVDEHFRSRRLDSVIEQGKRGNHSLTEIVEGPDFGGQVVEFVQPVNLGVNKAQEELKNRLLLQKQQSDQWQFQQRQQQEQQEIQRAELAAETQRQRLEQNAHLSSAILEALLDHTIHHNCSILIDSMYRPMFSEHLERTKSLRMNLTHEIFDTLIASVIKEVVDLNVIKTRVRLAERIDKRRTLIEELSEAVFDEILSGFTCDVTENVYEGQVERLFAMKKGFKLWCGKASLMISRKPKIIADQVITPLKQRLKLPVDVQSFSLNLPKQEINMINVIEKNLQPKSPPVHLVFRIPESRLNNRASLQEFLKPLSNLPNVLGHLQAFASADLCGIQMLASIEDDKSGYCFIVSMLECDDEGDLGRFWPSNYPAPTVVIDWNVPGESFREGKQGHFNFPWTVKQIKVSNAEDEGDDCFKVQVYPNGRVKDAKDTLNQLITLGIKESPTLPRLSLNQLPSAFFGPLINPFLLSPLAVLMNNNTMPRKFMYSLYSLLLENLVEQSIWWLIRSPRAASLLKWHPSTAGRSSLLECLSKCDSLLNQLRLILKQQQQQQQILEVEEGTECIFKLLDSFVGGKLILNEDWLADDDELKRHLSTSQNSIIRTFLHQLAEASDVKPISMKPSQPTSSTTSLTSIEEFRGKLAREQQEQNAFEDFLKKNCL